MNSFEARPEWLELAEAADIADLMQRFGNFHDSCVREIHVATSHYVDQDHRMHFDWRNSVQILVQRQFRNPSAIELRFDGVTGLHVSPPKPNCDSIIFDAAFFLREGVFYWAESSLLEPDDSSVGETMWVAARRVFWRDASDWLGPRLRYLAPSGAV